MSYLDNLKQFNLTENTKGSLYYDSSYDANLDVFCAISRFNDTEEIIRKFNNALIEDNNIALANLLYILDIRSGKGERLLFKTIFKELCLNNKDKALKILPFINKLGRWDYILEGIDTTINNEVIKLIKKQLSEDIYSDNPSLLAKWLPSHRTHNTNSYMAKNLIKQLGMNEKEYRQTLSKLRSKIDIVEKHLSEKNYDAIEFSKVPTKAMLKYTIAYNTRCQEKYRTYLTNVKQNKTKINTEGLYCYEIVKKIVLGLPVDTELYDLMWTNQKNIFENNDTNILVMADTSGSMTMFGCLPYANAVGLAIYIAERNKGIFKDHFITFSSEPKLQKIIGNNIVEKVNNIECINDNTDIDKAFELLLETAKKNNSSQEELPSQLIIISDMEFDHGVYTKNGTNFQGWQETFKENGYILPKIIFWNVACNTMGVPVTKYDNDVMMISGFSTSILENVLDLKNYNPIDTMMHTLDKYIRMLEG